MLLNPFRWGEAPKAYPTLVGVGSEGGASVLGNGDVYWPGGHQAGDVGILIVITAAATVNTPAGWTAIPNSAASSGTPDVAGSMGVKAFYRIATSGSMPASNVSLTGGYKSIFQIVVFRGVNQAAPVSAAAAGVQATAGTAFSLPDVTTTIEKSKILHAVGTNYVGGNVWSVLSGYTNPELVSITEHWDHAYPKNSALGSITIVSAGKETPGATGNTGVTSSYSAAASFLTLALNPA